MAMMAVVWLAAALLAAPAAAATTSLLLFQQRLDAVALPDGLTRYGSTQFLFGLDDARLQATSSVAFTCSVDGAPAAPCSSPLSLTGLLDGDHTVTVAAPALALARTLAWTVDATAPVLAWTLVPPLVVNQPGSALFNAHASEAVYFECALDGAAFAPCGAAPAALASDLVAAFSPAVAGPHAVAVRAFDLAGNPAAAITFSFSSDPCVAAGSCLPSKPLLGVPQCTFVDDGLFLDLRDVHICRRCRPVVGCTPNNNTHTLFCTTGLDSVCGGLCTTRFDPVTHTNVLDCPYATGYAL